MLARTAKVLTRRHVCPNSKAPCTTLSNLGIASETKRYYPTLGCSPNYLEPVLQGSRCLANRLSMNRIIATSIIVVR